MIIGQYEDVSIDEDPVSTPKFWDKFLCCWLVGVIILLVQHVFCHLFVVLVSLWITPTNWLQFF